MGFTLSNANGQARYLHKIHKMSKRLYEESGGNLGSEHFLVTVALLKLEKKWKDAEETLLMNGCVSECIDMYTDIHMVSKRSSQQVLATTF